MRFATFNVSLYGNHAGDIQKRLRDPDDQQGRCLAEIIQRTRPDVLLLCEFDYDESGAALQAFRENYLAQGQDVSGAPDGPAAPIDYPYWFSVPVNTGRPSGFDLNRDGRIGGPLGSDAYAGDCWGFGKFPGQYGMAVLSRYPFDEDQIRTFQHFRWRDLPAANVPDDPATTRPGDWYPADAMQHFPLSSKSHWDLPIVIGEQVVHLLASHPTPPTYDGPEDRNGLRNKDEIRFWSEYVEGTAAAKALYDDAGKRGGLLSGASFVIAGDLNGDPLDGDGPDGIRILLASPKLQSSPIPASSGGSEQARLQGGANRRHQGDAANDTCDPADDPGPGNLRIDYVLPSRGLRIVRSGVFWPSSDDPLYPLTGVYPFPSSDHRLVWIDVETTTEGPNPKQ
ncbi:MAG: endonuclease/exonuclease/phosphatase family protein [Planctomycetales bacterium]|nr:endonuclease/exonuclease/phosphatase family protein [Planctomycetales bacterium]